MKTLKFLNTKISKYPVAILLTYGILLRILVVVCYNAITIFPDTQNYIDLANTLLNFDVINYSGERTPGFPTLIALAGGNLYITIFFQLILGLLAMYLMYDFFKLKSQDIPFAFWCSTITTSFIYVIFYEFAILTESLTYFMLTLTFWFIEKFHILKLSASIKHYFILSLILGCLYLTRPMFIYVPIGFSLFYLVKNFNFDIRKTFIKSLSMSLLPLVTFYAWCSVNEKNINQFTSSYYLGINLAQVATSFFDKAPEEHRLIRDIFVKHRAYIEANEPDYAYPMTVWYAYDELLEKTQLSPPNLSNKLGEISKKLFKKYPGLYLKQVGISWLHFWNARNALMWNVDKFENRFIRRGLIGLWIYIQGNILIAIHFLFVLFVFKKIIQFFTSGFHLDSDLFLVAIVMGGSLAQALVTFGTNSRFAFPYLPLIVYFVAVNVTTLKNNYAKRTLS
ncbi:MAG: hypothetical protein ACK5M1_07465 [Xanthomarina gelatinilytica]|uniref:hypothetical protein n=1 Tax=Xanthomarina gelatinilytica TaxID=1137281 RepID=UPI003A86F3AC